MGAQLVSSTPSRKVFYTCSYVPEELILACGLLPVRLLGGGEPASAEGHLHPRTCGYAKSLLASARERSEALVELLDRGGART